MNKFIAEVYVEITRVTDDSGYPDLVEFALTDIDGRRHFFRDKLPVVSIEDSVLPPCAGALRCHIIGEKENSYLIDTSFPDYVDSVNEEFIFEVVKDHIIKR